MWRFQSIELLIWLAYISSFSIILPLIFGLLNFSRLESLQKIFFAFIVFSTIFEGIVFYTTFNNIHNIVLFKIFLCCELVFFTWFYTRSTPFPIWLKAGTILLSLFSVISFIEHSNLISESLFFILIFLFLLIQSIFIILTLFKNFDHSPIQNYLFWIGFARIFYFLIIITVYICLTILPTNFNGKIYGLAFSIINSLGNIVGNSLYSINFLCRKT